MLYDKRMEYPLLLSPLQIGELTLPNRIVRPPMVTFLAEDDGLVTRAHLDHYERSSGTECSETGSDQVNSLKRLAK